jgi:hypothetical protein
VLDATIACTDILLEDRSLVGLAWKVRFRLGGNIGKDTQDGVLWEAIAGLSDVQDEEDKGMPLQASPWFA